jgi:catechol 2,3-dioxygenase-like lactoylglutathione lyase family enzyme
MSASEYSSQWSSGIGYHIGITVPDMDEALRFYRDLLGMEQSWSQTFGGPGSPPIKGGEKLVVQLICPGGSRLELACYKQKGNYDTRGPNDYGFNHLCLGVSDVRATYRRLLDAGVKFDYEPKQISKSPMQGWYVTFFSDPWGTIIELLGPDPEHPADTGEREP